MLTITIPEVETFDEVTNEFNILSEETTLQLEHSLVSLSKWEAIWEKPFLSQEEKTQEEAISYIQTMTLTPNIPPEIYQYLSTENYEQINSYINAKQSATWFTELSTPAKNNVIITAELIYYWMFSLTIPKECEEWNLSRLFTQIKVFNEKNAPEKKMSPRDVAARNRMLNEQRKAKYNTTG